MKQEQPDGDEADRDAGDWPACLSPVYSLFCCVGLHVNYHDIKTINKTLHPLCCLVCVSASSIQQPFSRYSMHWNLETRDEMETKGDTRVCDVE